MVLPSLLRLRRRLLQGRLDEDFGRVVDAALVPRGQVVRLEQPRLSLVTKYVALAIDDPEPIAELRSLETLDGTAEKSVNGSASEEARAELPAPENAVADTPAEERTAGALPQTGERRRPSTKDAQQTVEARADTRDGVKKRRARPARAAATAAASTDAHEVKTKDEPEPAPPTRDDATAEAPPAGARDNHRARRVDAKESATQASTPRRRQSAGSKRSPARPRRAAKKENEAEAAVEADADAPAAGNRRAGTRNVNGKVSAQSCTIAVWRGKGTARFYGRSFDVLGNEIVVGESPPFRYDGDGIPEEDAATTEAHAQLVEVLRRRGWETSKKGWTWFALTLTRV